MSDTMNLIKDLRSKTGAGFLDCKKALSENNNSLDEAIEYLRKKGLAKASKKSSREANEGAIGIYSNDNLTALLKINSETDFAAKSDTFLNFLDDIGNAIIENDNVSLTKEHLLNLNFKDDTIANYLKNKIAQIGENLILKDLLIIENNKSYNSYYIHNSYRKNIGKIISLINYETNSNDDNIKSLSKNICMHVAAMKPEALDIKDLDNSLIEKEKKIQKELILSSGKPENIVDKILEGKMNKYYSEVTLLNQNFILDQDKTVSQIISDYKEKYNYKIISYNIFSL